MDATAPTLTQPYAADAAATASMIAGQAAGGGTTTAAGDATAGAAAGAAAAGGSTSSVSAPPAPLPLPPPPPCTLRVGGAGGFAAYRGVLCCADCSCNWCTESAAAVPVGESTSLSQWRLRLPPLNQWRQLRDAIHLGAPLPQSHSPLCRPVMAKASNIMHPYPEQMAVLRWELLVMQRAAAGSPSARPPSAAGARPPSAAGALTPGSDSSSSSSGGRRPSVGSTSSATARGSVPSITQPPDGRSALLLADPLGPSLEQRLATGRDFIVTFTLQPRLAPHGHQHAGHVQVVEKRGAVLFRSVTLLALDRLMGALRGVINVSVSIALALQQLHVAGIVHRAMRPSNIVLPWTPTLDAHQFDEWRAPPPAAFIDLSSASLLANDKPKSDLSPHSYPLSSWLYMAPEQSGRTSSTIDNRTDLYTLGILMSVTPTCRAVKADINDAGRRPLVLLVLLVCLPLCCDLKVRVDVRPDSLRRLHRRC